jgi:uncharacterized membrane protein YdjX (TVP38/TMEM64 family)
MSNASTPAHCIPRPSEPNRLRAWLLLVIAAALLGWLFPEWLEPSRWRMWSEASGPALWLLLLVLQCSCALLMVPSLPLVLASTLLYPDQPAWVLLLALVGVLFSALLIRANARFLQLHRQPLQRRFLRRARVWIRRHGSPALCLWCMAPFLPTDLGCYIAAAARMPLSRYLPAILVGESVLCAAVVYGVAGLVA